MAIIILSNIIKKFETSLSEASEIDTTLLKGLKIQIVYTNVGTKKFWMKHPKKTGEFHKADEGQKTPDKLKFRLNI